MKRRLWKTLLSVLLVAALFVCAIPTSAASVSTNYDTLVQYINQNGELDDEGHKTLGVYVTEGSNTVYFFLTNLSTGVEFKLVLLGTASERVDMELSFILQKYNNYLNVKLYALYVYSNQYIDELDRTKSVNRTQHTIESQYTVTGSTYIPAEGASELFNMGLQSVCAFWDVVLQDELGFGLKGLGFNSYCIHEYDHDCDSDCNLCGKTRITNHSFTGYWEDAGENHIQVCTVCDYHTSGVHNFLPNAGKNTEPSCTEDGQTWYTCSDCGKEKCDITPKSDEYHVFTPWQKVDEESHSRICDICREEEAAPHSWDSGKLIQMPTEDAPGIITYTCTDCSATKTLEIDYIPGDIDANGVVNRDDVVQLLLYVSMPEAFPIAIPADYNGDGLVTRDDVIQLLLHVSMPDTFPLQ